MVALTITSSSLAAGKKTGATGIFLKKRGNRLNFVLVPSIFLMQKKIGLCKNGAVQ